MKNTKTVPFDALERIFHEPSRLAILVSLRAASGHALSFGELRDAAGLTDGNLNRHIAALLEDDVVRMKKEFIGVRPRTTIFLTREGADRFTAYVEALQIVLQAVRASAAKPATARRTGGKPARSSAGRFDRSVTPPVHSRGRCIVPEE